MSLRGFSPIVPIAPRGGYASLQYSVADAVQTDAFVRTEENGQLLGFTPGVFHFFSLPQVPITGKNYTITPVESKQGTPYDIVINGAMTNVSTDAIAELSRMKKLDFAVKMFTADNRPWLMLDYEFPATFNFTVEGGDVGSNRSRIKFTFKGRTPYVPLSI